MTDTGRVDVDTAALELGLRQLAGGLDALGPRVGSATARAVASRLSGNLPVRSGRLRATVSTSNLPNGAAVHYGAGVPYAGYIDGRTNATGRALSGAPATFATAMYAAAAAEVARL